MAPMSDEQFRNASAKLRDRLLRLKLKKLREMNDKYFARPRAPARQGGARSRRGKSPARDATVMPRNGQSPQGTTAASPRWGTGEVNAIKEPIK